MHKLGSNKKTIRESQTCAGWFDMESRMLNSRSVVHVFAGCRWLLQLSVCRMPLAPSLSVCRMPWAPFAGCLWLLFFFRTPRSPFLEGNSEICTHGHLLFFWQSAGFLFGPAVSYHGLGRNFCDSALFGWDSNASCDEKKEWILIVLVMKLLESGRHARHWQSSCFLVAAPFTILTACRVLVLSLFMRHLYIYYVLSCNSGDSEKKSPYVMTDDFHLVKWWGSCIGKCLD